MDRRNLGKLSAIGAVLLTALASNFAAKADGPADLKAETQTVTSYLDDLGRTGRNVSELNKRPSLARADFDKATGDVDSLKRRLSDVERAVSAMIRKLKDSGEWEGYDEQVAKSLTDPKARELLSRCGGPKRCLEAASRLTSDSGELDHLLDPLRTKSQARAGDQVFDGRPDYGVRFVPAAYRAFYKDSLACTLSRAVMKHVGTSKSINRAYCFCVEMPVLDGESLSQCMATP